MWYMNGTESCGRHRLSGHEGFAAAYFLMLFLLAGTVITGGMEAERDALAAVVSLQQAAEYQNAEALLLDVLKCRLLKNEAEDGIISAGDASGEIQVMHDTVILEIHMPVQEIMTVTYDPETAMVLDFQAERPAANGGRY